MSKLFTEKTTVKSKSELTNHSYCGLMAPKLCKSLIAPAVGQDDARLSSVQFNLSSSTSSNGSNLGVYNKPWIHGLPDSDYPRPIFPGPSFPGPSFPGVRPFPTPHLPWSTNSFQEELAEQVRRKINEKKKEEEWQRLILEKIKLSNTLQPDSVAIKKKKQSEQARGFAEGVELAQGSLGGRHQLRLALAAGHAEGIRRCWGVILEKGFETEVLNIGRSETLMAATLGESSDIALAFLIEVGFTPGSALASQALLTLLASGQGFCGLKCLILDFKAGSLHGDVVAEIDRKSKGLGAMAYANGESYEIEVVSASAPIPSASIRRL